MKKIILNFLYAVILSFILILSFASCENGKSTDDLSGWVGTYTFKENFDNREYEKNELNHKIVIYEEQGDYFAEIEVDFPVAPSFTTVYADVFGNKEWINLIYSGGVNLDTGTQKTDLLLSLRRDGADIYTHWSRFFPFISENHVSNSIWFIKENDDFVYQNNNTQEDLSDWVGTYTYKEIYDWEPETEHNHTVIVYEENGDYFAHVEINDNWGTDTFMAKVSGTKEWIILISLEYKNVLLGFRREKSNIYTHWGKINIATHVYSSPKEIYFEKVDDS